MKQLRTLNDAMEFIHGTFYYAGLNLNPDLGFLKADNTSAFPKLTDEGAQKSQAYLVQAEEILRKENMDIWEVCMEMSIYITTHAWAQAALLGTNLESAEWLEHLRTKHDGHAEMRIMAWPIEDETKEDREFRDEEKNTVQPSSIFYIGCKLTNHYSVSSPRKKIFRKYSRCKKPWMRML